jgi:hypothetical protein
MQIIVLEYNVRYNNEIKENLESEFKLLSENFSLKEDEINFLRQKINSNDNNNNNNNDKEKEQIFYNEINKIRDLLKEKTSEMIKMEQKQIQKNYENLEKTNKIKEINNTLIEENEKMKEIFQDILTFHSEGKTKELDQLLNFLQNNNQIIFNEENQNQNQNQNQNKNPENYMSKFIDESEKNASSEFLLNFFFLIIFFKIYS